MNILQFVCTYMNYACVLYAWVRALSYFYTCVAIFQSWNSHCWPLGGPKHVLQMSVLLAQAQELSVEVSWVWLFCSGFLVLQSRQFQQGRWESLYPSERPPQLDSRDSYPAPWPHKFARSEALRTGHHVIESAVSIVRTVGLKLCPLGLLVLIISSGLSCSQPYWIGPIAYPFFLEGGLGFYPLHYTAI